MRKKNSSTIQLLENEGLLQDEEKEIIEYGLQQVKLYFFSIIITLVLGIIFGIFTQSIIFLLAFIPLRMYAGGYHADSQIRCFISSFIILLVSFCCIKYISWNSTICFILSSISVAIIYFLAPIENSTRKLEVIEKLVFRKKTRFIAISVYLIIIFSTIFKFNKLAEATLVAIIIVSLSLLVGYIKYYKKK